MKTLRRIGGTIWQYLRLGAIFKIPGGITPDLNGLYGFFGLISNLNNYSEAIVKLTTAGTNITLTASQATVGIVQLNTGASGGFTITLPTTAALISSLGPTIPTDGTYAEPLSILNNNVGQTGTLTAGDASTTLNGTMTVATNTCRMFLMTVTGPSTVSFDNLGTKTL